MVYKKVRLKILFLSGLLLLAIVLAVALGAVRVKFWELFSEAYRPILYLRLMRILLAIIAGLGLSFSGIVLQALLKNPLAEPYILGTSSGAGLGAVVALYLGISQIFLPLFAFLGAVLSVFLVYSLARENNRIDEHSLVLSGVMISIAFSAIVVFIISTTGTQGMHNISWWLWGNLQVYDLGLFTAVSIIVIISAMVILFFAQELDAISLGEEEALHLGVDIERVKKILLFLVTLISASIVCVCGIIGFVGLMIPHLMRFWISPKHRLLLPSSFLASSSFLVFCDCLSRSLLPSYEIPIGIITSILGAPIFIFILRKRTIFK